MVLISFGAIGIIPEGVYLNMVNEVSTRIDRK